MEKKSKYKNIEEGELQELLSYQKAIDQYAIVAKTDPKGRITYVNDLFCEVSEYDREELIGKDHRILNSGKHSKKFMTNLWRTISRGDNWRGEICNKTKSGSFYWVNTVITPIKSEEGEIVEFLAVRYLITEQKVSEEGLKEANKKLSESYTYLKSIQDNASHAIIATNTEGIITNFNKKAEELLGYKREEFIGKESPAKFHELDEVIERSKIFGEILGRKIKPGFETFICLSQEGLRNTFEWTYIHKNGDQIPVLLSITTIKNDEGEITGFLGLAQDLREQKNLEVEFKKRNDDLELAQSIAKVGSWSYDLNTGKISWSKEMFNIFPEDIEKGEPDFIRHRSTIHPADVDHWQEVVNKCLENGEAYVMAFRTHKKNDPNAIVWVEARGQGHFVDGKIVSLSGTCQDITEARLRDQELKLILESNEFGIWKFNPITNELHWDESMYSLFGIKKKDFSGAYDAWVSTLHPEGAEKAQEDFQKALNGKGNFEGSFQIITSKGKVKHIGARANIDRDNEGNPLFAMGINWDQTKEKVVHEKLKLHAKQLEVAEIAAKKAEKAKSEFLANMSHEIRTPMNGIIGMLELLNETSLTDQQKEMFETVTSSSQALMGLLSDILDISKIEAGKLIITEEDFSLNKVLKELNSLMMARAQMKGNQLRLVTPLEDHWVKGDQTRVRQIMTNFLSNAVKFTSEGEITFGFEVDANDTYLLFVRDTGIGIKKENQQKLFEAFVQADPSITRKFGGTGLGLAICAKLANLLRGRVYFESEEGKGTTFFFETSFKKTSTKVNPNFTEEKRSELAKKYPHTILVVEDNPINQKVVKMTLEKYGYGCDLAGNGEVALEILTLKGPEHYSLIFMDMQMPVMDGITATRKIRQKFKNHDTLPIIALTANAFESDKKDCLEAGMNGYLSKPLRKNDLVDILVKYSENPSLKMSS